jgi:transmembrane sensor
LTLGGGGIALAVSALLVVGFMRPAPIHVETFSTAPGEVRRLELPDGSSLTLSGRTQVSVTISKRTRMVDIIGGEALFAVSHDGRPFVVTAGPLRATVLGTRFNIDRSSESADLAVLDGSVRAEAGGDTRILEANQTVRAATNGLFALDVSVDAQTAWTQGRIDAANTNVGALMTELSRFTRKPVVVVDESLAAKSVAGHFDVDDAEATMRLVAELHQLTVVETETAFVLSIANNGLK